MQISSPYIPKKQKALRWLELIILFIGLPSLYLLKQIPFHKAVPLALAFLFCLILLLQDKSFDRKQLRLGDRAAWRPWWKPMLLRFALFAVATTALVYFWMPDRLFSLFDYPRLMILIWTLYPLWSVVPQELIFRPFFFHRYPMILRHPQALLWLNAALFSFAHIIFRNEVALIATFAGSFMFSRTYKQTGSLLAVSIEHALYGNWVFTVGLGKFFYLPL